MFGGAVVTITEPFVAGNANSSPSAFAYVLADTVNAVPGEGIAVAPVSNGNWMVMFEVKTFEG